MPPKFRYDRRVEDTFAETFLPSGPLHSLVDYARGARYPVDLQFRGSFKSKAGHASLYVGLNTVLDAHWSASGKISLTAHDEFAGSAGDPRHQFRPDWRTPRAPEGFRAEAEAIESYLDSVIPSAAARRGTEGGVQSSLSSSKNLGLTTLDREAALSFADSSVKKGILADEGAALVRALRRITGAPKSFGGECDVLAVRDGRLVTIEVKPRGVPSIRWAPAQALMYARLFGRWLREDNDAAEIIQGQLVRRQQLGLLDGPVPRVDPSKAVLPVLAIQRGSGAALLSKMQAVRLVLHEAQIPEADDLEVHELNLLGTMGDQI